MSSIFAATVCALVLSADAGCGDCRWRLCKLNGQGTVLPNCRTLTLRGPKTALAPYVCLPNSSGDMGRTDISNIKTGDATVYSVASPTPISKWRPTGLRKKFSKKYFGLYPICFTDGLQGIGRLQSKANQEFFLGGICVVLPITSYKRKGRTIRTSRKDDCVSFRTRTQAIIVELQWDTSDDLDLSVEEPDGDLLSFRNKSTEYGSLNNDIAVAVCGNIPSGKENVFYRPNPNIERGRYIVRVRHWRNCGPDSRRTISNWKLRVIINGKIVVEKKGTSDKDNDEVITKVNFRF